MAGGHSSQRNKQHKAGKRAGLSARARSRNGKTAIESSSQRALRVARKGKESRAQAASSARHKSRQEALHRLRHEHAPIVIQMLSTSSLIDEQRAWDLIRTSCDVGTDATSLKDYEEEQTETGMSDEIHNHTYTPVTLRLPGRNSMRITLLPPLSQELRQDVHALVDVAKSADVVLLCMPHVTSSKRSKPDGAMDGAGYLALQVLRSMGLPQILVAVQGAGSSMKDRSLAKKVANNVLESELGSDLKVAPLDTLADCVTLLRHLVASKIESPLWRQGRPHLLVEGCTYSKPQTDATTGTLLLDAYVRHVGLSANQPLTIPGGGDFSIDQVWAAPEKVPQNSRADSMVVETLSDLPLLSKADHDREPVVRENPQAAEQMSTEQTWPTQEEMAANEPQRRLRAGTSDYQACWILDEEEDEEDGNGNVLPSENMVGAPRSRTSVDLGSMHEGSEGGSDIEMDTDELDMEEVKRSRAERRRRAEDDDLNFPDEIDTPHDVPARERFQKYRGLKSFRTSPWDPKEDLPVEYAKVFALEIFARARKLAGAARKAVLEGSVPGVVLPGTYVRVAVTEVPEASAARVCDRVGAFLMGASPPLVAFGLQKHESKLSVVNMAVNRLTSYDGSIANKEAVTVITGTRTFDARPILSTNDYNVDKFKQEKFMHPGRTYMMSVFAPISYPQLPVLVVKKGEDNVPQLVATGSVQDCNPDRIVLKRIVLTGYPVKVHKKKAVVRYMFFNPDDVRWFKPLEVWTKHGRRGRIKESLGTHGGMKCIFDAPVQQHDSVCLALYKRVFPKWPEDLSFNSL